MPIRIDCWRCAKCARIYERKQDANRCEEMHHKRSSWNRPCGFYSDGELLEKLCERVVLPESDKWNKCWGWGGAVSTAGYPTMPVKSGKYGFAHRISYELSDGRIPKGLFVCHSCDTPKCTNPFHLFLGTPADNARDTASKGRFSMKPRLMIQGSKHVNSRLNEDDIRKIRQMREQGMTQSKVAHWFTVSRSAIEKIDHGEMWAQVDGAWEKQ